MIEKIIPNSILELIWPARYQKKYNRFIKVADAIAGKDFFLYLREDSFMEKVIQEKGLYGEWEKESLKIWAELSKSASVIFDIGANTGIFSMLAQNNNKDATIIAVEPIEINHGVLLKNIQKNNFSIKAEKIAMSDKEGTAKMFMLKDRLNYMTSVNEDRYADAPHVKGDFETVEVAVPIKTFAAVVDKYQLQRVDLIKLDIEGHEIPVLKNMLPYIEKFRPHILIEVIGDDNAAELNHMFGNLGYKFLSIDETNKSVQVDKVWDNHHHNFLFTSQETIDLLISKNLAKHS